MQRESRVGIALYISLTTAGLALAGCSSEAVPPGSDDVPDVIVPLALPKLAGGQAMKLFIHPLTGELLDPGQVERTTFASGAGARRELTLRRVEIVRREPCLPARNATRC